MTGYAHRLVSCGFAVLMGTCFGLAAEAAAPERSPAFGPPAPVSVPASGGASGSESIRGADLGQASFDASLIVERIGGSREAAASQDGANDDSFGPGCSGNLITNGDFETFTPCPNNIGQLSFAPPWYLPTPGSADFFHACAGSGVGVPGIPINFYGSVTPFSGGGVAGLRVYGNVPPGTSTDYREYLQIPLNASLVAGQTYTLSFRVILNGTSSAYGIKELDAYFSSGPVYSGAITQLNYIPQFTNPGPPITSTSSWTLVTGTFIAAGGENHMTIGNFKPDATTTFVVAGGGCCPVSYYYIDDVCLTGMAGTMFGACCYQSAGGLTCSQLTAAQCATLNGWFQGKGTDCAVSPCTVPIGGCCLPGPINGVNICQIEIASDCAALGGTYLGDGVFCVPGDPCNPPLGACCYAVPGSPFSDCAIVSQIACVNTYGGTYMGDGSVCLPDPCNTTGGCCYPDPAGSGNLCVVTTSYDCEDTLLGIYLGNGTPCPVGNCNPLPAKGACCYQMSGSTSYACVQTSPAGCASYFNSFYLGLGVSCPPDGCNDSPLGACCYVHPSGSTICVLATQDDCEDDLNGTYIGNGTTCQPNPCFSVPTGACCYQDVPNPTFLCAITTPLNCAQNFPNSTYMGNGSACTPNPCPPELNGGCCFIDPTTGAPDCVLTNAADCDAVYHGTYQGNGTLCTPNPCAPIGACCYQSAAGAVCVTATAAECVRVYSGIYQGDNVPCTPNPCAPTGACCSTGPQGLPVCTITTQQLCTQQLLGNWLGANTTCNPNPCEPLGACCWHDAVTSPLKCIIVSQAVCATYPNSLWQGANTTCNPNPCPSGACCYQIQVQGITTYTCMVTTAQNCATLLNSTFYGVGTNCNNIECRPCVRPPQKMVAWWTLDELVGGIANDSIAGHHGAYKPTVATGPIPGPGMVGGGLSFDGANDFVQVPHSGQLNFGCAAFTIDAWVRPLSLSGGIVRKIAVNGYDFHIVPGGQLGLRLNSTSGTCNLASIGTIAAGQWTHVAVTATAGGPTRTVTFYINGVASGSFVTPCVCVGNPAPVIIGQSAVTGFLRGRLDEIEMFRRALPAAEILAIFNAGTVGKCKTRIHAPFNTPLCLNQNSVTVPVTICNDSPTPFSYNVSFQPLNSCTIPGPTVFTPLFTNPVNVPANGCVTVNVTINRPIGMVAVNQVACYQINALNLSTGQTFYGQGSLKDRRDLCAVIGPCCIGTGVIDVPIGTPISVGVKVTNTSGQAISTPVIIQGFDSQDGSPSDDLRLSSLAPGTRLMGNLSLPPGGERDIVFTLGYELHNALAVDDVVISTDIDGDGTFEPLWSIGAGSIPKLCRGDVIADGFVNVQDLLAVIGQWGACPPAPSECPADIAPAGPPPGNGVVNVEDLLAVIGTWGECQ